MIYNMHSIVLDVQYGVYMEISGFWQGQEVWSSDTSSR
jgi:hypothetical protein